MKNLLSILALLCAFGFPITSVVQGAPTIKESVQLVKGTLMEIDGSFYVIKDLAGKEQRVHVDKSTIIIGKVRPGVQVKAQLSKDGHASAIMIAES